VQLLALASLLRFDAREIGRELNARYLLEGSLQNQNSRLRVTAELVDTETGAHVWSMKFDRTPTDVFALQDEIAVSVGRALEQSVTVSADRRATGSGTENLEAWLALSAGSRAGGHPQADGPRHCSAKVRRSHEARPSFGWPTSARAEARAVRSIFSASDTWLGVLPRFLCRRRAPRDGGSGCARYRTRSARGTAYTVRAWLTDSDSATAAEADYRRGSRSVRTMQWATSASQSVCTRSSSPMAGSSPL